MGAISNYNAIKHLDGVIWFNIEKGKESTSPRHVVP